MIIHNDDDVDDDDRPNDDDDDDVTVADGSCFALCFRLCYFSNCYLLSLSSVSLPWCTRECNTISGIRLM